MEAQVTNKLSNLQLELLKIYSFDIKEKQLIEIKSILAKYFANEITNGVDKLFEQKGWGVEKIDEWSKEHMRVKTTNE